MIEHLRKPHLYLLTSGSLATVALTLTWAGDVACLAAGFLTRVAPWVVMPTASGFRVHAYSSTHGGWRWEDQKFVAVRYVAGLRPA